MEVNKTKFTLCRFCAQQESCAEVLNLTGDLKTYLHCLEIIDYLNIDFLPLSQSITLPKTSCKKCYDSFQAAYTFFKTLEENQNVLRKIYGSNEECIETTTSRAENDVTTDQSEKGAIVHDLSNKTMVHCRFCAEQKTSTELQDISKDENAFDKYKKIVTFFKISYLDVTQNFPNTACGPCLTSFCEAYNFFDNVKQNQSILNKLCNVKTEHVDKITIKLEAENVNEDAIDSKSQIKSKLVSQNFIPCYNVTVDMSWTSYTWICCHCGIVYETLQALRSHSKEKHNMCYATCCADCSVHIYPFNEFVDHVRAHRESLSLYCQYCNEGFSSKEECEGHVHIHWTGTQKICDLCGEMLPSANTLQWHKKLYGFSISDDPYGRQGRSWVDYEWSCQDCPFKAPDVSSLRAHAQQDHRKCFSMRCADCSTILQNYKMFVEHVTRHRPHLRHYCQYCNTQFKNTADLSQHIIKHITSQQRPCNICGQIFDDNAQLAVHKDMYATTVQCTPPKNKKTNTKKRKTVRNTTVKSRRKVSVSLDTEDLTCQTCFKHFDAPAKLNKHLKTHDARTKDYVCRICGSAFLTGSSLKEHAKKHSVKSEVCQVCKKEFHSKRKLKAHAVTHLELRPFVCDECGGSFKTKRRLQCHLKSHSDVKPFKCMFCFKEFKSKENMKSHEYQHTGARPYSCEYCDKTFTNWTNCNKHMIRKHGVTLARTKITSQGRVAVNRRTGEADVLPADKDTMDWLNNMLKPQKRGENKAK